jgi:hypothetical protein
MKKSREFWLCCSRVWPNEEQARLHSNYLKTEYPSMPEIDSEVVHVREILPKKKKIPARYKKITWYDCDYVGGIERLTRIYTKKEAEALVDRYQDICIGKDGDDYYIYSYSAGH